MAYMLGLDASLVKTGYAVIHLEGPDKAVVEKGLLRTSPDDGITILRLLKQQRQIKEKILKYNTRIIGMEAPYFMGNETEKLFALNQFLHAVFLRLGLWVVQFPPSTLKKLTCPDLDARQIKKPHMIDAAKTALSMHGQRFPEDAADAFWAGWFGRRFYRYFIEKSLQEKDLGTYERKTFCGKHTYTKGKKKGATTYQGIAYRENELYFDFEAIKRRLINAQKGNQESRKENDKKSGKENSQKDG